jgi:hypothetical protein
VPEARRLPLSRLLNAPCRVLQEREDVMPEAHMAEVLLPQEAATERRGGETRQRPRDQLPHCRKILLDNVSGRILFRERLGYPIAFY